MANRRIEEEGQLSTSVSSAIYTVPANMVLVGARLLTTNTDTSSDIAVTVHTDKAGGAASANNLRVNGVVVTAKEDRPFSLPNNLSSGAKIYGKAGTADAVNWNLTGVLIPQSVST